LGERVGRFLARAPRAAGIALIGGTRRFLHRTVGAARGGLRLPQRHGLGRAIHAARQRVGGRGEIALRGGSSRIGMWRVFLVPFRLAPLQVFGVLGERGQLAFERGSLEQLLTPLELAAQLLLRIRQPLQCLACGFGIEPRERFLQLAQPLLELRRQRALQQVLHFL